MTNIFRSLSFAIVQAIYPLIPDLYGVVLDLASNKYFTTEAIQTLSGNIYIIISVCMLFALALKLISAIVNPDMLTDQKKGVRSVALHIIFAVFLIVLIPIAFDKMYELQEDVVENQLIEKIVLGMDTDDSNQPGQILAAYAFASFCEPQETVSAQALSSQGQDLYNKALTEDIDYIKQMDGVINSKTNGEYDLQYNAILAPAVGLYLIYQLILMAMDMALRTIKLGMLQLVTPVILCGYVIAGTDILQKWAKMVASTFVLLFLKIAMISFMIYGLSLLPDFLDNFASKSFWYRGFLRVFMIIGLLQLIKQIPDIINGIFGTNIKSRGGIRGRLGEMAAVGELAQRGWDQLRQHPLQSAARLASAPISAVGGFATHTAAAIRSGIDRGRATAERIRAEGGRAATLRGILTGAAQGGAGVLTSGAAAWRAGREGLQNGNLRGIGGARQRYVDTHPADSTFGGRLLDTITEGTGYGTRKTREEEADKYIDTYETRVNPATGVEERVRTGRMTLEQYQVEQQRLQAVKERADAITSAAQSEIERGDSHIQFDCGALGTGTYQQLLERLNAHRDSGDWTEDELADASRQLSVAKEAAIHQVATQAMQGVATFDNVDARDGDGNVATHITTIDDQGNIGGALHGGVMAGIRENLDVLHDTYDGMAGVNNWEAMHGVTNGIDGQLSDMSYSMNRKSSTEANRNITRGHVSMEADNRAVNARNNNGGNNGGGGNGH